MSSEILHKEDSLFLALRWRGPPGRKCVRPLEIRVAFSWQQAENRDLALFLCRELNFAKNKFEWGPQAQKRAQPPKPWFVPCDILAENTDMSGLDLQNDELTNGCFLYQLYWDINYIPQNSFTISPFLKWWSQSYPLSNFRTSLSPSREIPCPSIVAFHFSFHNPLETTIWFLFLCNWLFLTFCVNWITYHVTVCIWFLLPSIIFLRFTCVVACVRISFLFKAE